MKVKDETGKRYGMLIALEFVRLASNRAAIWKCRCDCGVEKELLIGRVKFGTTKSCGCYRRSRSKKHGETIGGRTPRYKIWVEAKARAKCKGMVFSIKVEDIIIPEFCPLLGIKLVNHSGGGSGPKDDSASLDRIDTNLGYISGNIWVVSNRANRIKSDSSLEELELLVRNLRKVY